VASVSSLSNELSAPVKPRLTWLWPAFVVVFAAVGTMTTNIVDPDLWGHYQYGKEALRDGELATTTTWSYAVEGHPWVNHENVAEVATAWVADQFGVAGLTLGKLMFAAFIIACVACNARREQVAWPLIGVVAILAADNMRFHWQFRPQAFSYAYFAAMAAILEWCFAGWNAARPSLNSMLAGERPAKPDLYRLRGLWVLPPLLCLWTNTHGGFAAGLAIYCAYLGLRALEAIWWWRGESVGVVKRLAMMIVAGILATCVNPYGPNLHLWMLDTLTAAPPEIGDWASLPIWSSQATGFWLLMAVMAVALIKSKRPRDLVHLVLMSLVLWQSLKHCRHLCFFAMMAAFWTPQHLQSAIQPIIDGWRRQAGAPTATRTLAHLCLLPITVWLLAIAFELGPKISVLPVERKEYPVSAMQFLRDRDLHGRTMVTFNWAQYAIACFADEGRENPSLVAIDGRLNTCYPREILDIYLDFLLGEPTPESRLRAPTSGPYDPALALSYAGPDLFLLDRGQKPAQRVMQNQSDWVLLYQDSLAQIWGRRDRYDNPESSDYLPPDLRRIGDEPQTGFVQWPAFPASRAQKVALR
jgi:hypothetical protein